MQGEEADAGVRVRRVKHLLVVTLVSAVFVACGPAASRPAASPTPSPTATEVWNSPPIHFTPTPLPTPERVDLAVYWPLIAQLQHALDTDDTAELIGLLGFRFANQTGLLEAAWGGVGEGVFVPGTVENARILVGDPPV